MARLVAVGRGNDDGNYGTLFPSVSRHIDNFAAFAVVMESAGDRVYAMPAPAPDIEAFGGLALPRVRSKFPETWIWSDLRSK